MAKRQRKAHPPRREHRRLLVVTEGLATEKQYVERLNQHLRDSAVAVSVKAVGVRKDPLEVVKKCIELKDAAARSRKAYDQCVCLVDVDQHTTLDEAAKTARAADVGLLVSRLKFEVWLLWHTSESRAANSSKQLDALMAKHELLYKEKHLALRFPIENVDDAVHTARLADPEMAMGRVGPDPSTAMPLLVALMRREDPGPHRSVT